MARSTRASKRERGLGGKQGTAGKTGARGPRRPRGRPGRTSATIITRDEFTAAVDAINGNLQQLRVQFQRIAQLQAELDGLKRLVARLAERSSGERE